jgi:hypothetical protein
VPRQVQKHRFRDETSQALVLMALALPLFFGFAAVVVDGSTLMAQRRSVQNAADAAALAAAQELPLSGVCAGAYTDPYPSTCQSRVLWAANHFSHDVNHGPIVDHACVDTPGTKDTNCYTNPYKGSYQLVEVRLRKPIETFFTNVVGLSNIWHVSTRAVTTAAPIVGTVTNPDSTVTNPDQTITNPPQTITNPPETVTSPIGAPALVYTKSTACPSIKISGQENVFHGALQTRGGFDIAFDNDGDWLQWGGVNPHDCFKLHDDLPEVDGTSHPRWKTVTSPAPSDFPVPPPTYSPTSGTYGTVSWPGLPPDGPTTVACTAPAPTQVKPATHPVALAASPTGATEAPLPSHTVTLTTSVAKGFSGWSVGDSITVASVANTNYNGTFTITGVPSTTQITYTSTRSNLPASGGGTVLNNNPSAPALPPGLYCLNNPISITQDVNLANVGFAGTKISVASNVLLDHGYLGPPALLPAQYHGLLMLATDNGSNAVQMSGANVRWTGAIFAPFGKATISGAGSVVGSSDLQGFIESDTVQFAGCCATWYGLGLSAGGYGTVTNPGSTVTNPGSTVTNPGNTVTNPGSTNTVTTGTTIGLGE